MKYFLKPHFILGLIFFFLGLYFAFKDFNYVGFLEVIKTTNIFYVLLASFFLIFSVWFRAIRWHYLLIKAKSIPYKNLFEIEMLGFFGNNVLPLRLGELYRSIILSNRFEISKSTVIGSIVLERILDTLGLVFFSIFLLFYPLENQIKNYVYYGLIFSFVLSIVLFLIKKIFYDKIKIEIIDNFLKGLYSLDKKYLIQNISISIFLWLIYWINTFLIQYSLDIKMSLMETLFILMISSLAIAIPSAPGMIGTFHLAVVYSMESILGYSSDIASAYAILLHAFGFISLTFVGTFYFIKYQSYPLLIIDD